MNVNLFAFNLVINIEKTDRDEKAEVDPSILKLDIFGFVCLFYLTSRYFHSHIDITSFTRSATNSHLYMVLMAAVLRVQYACLKTGSLF